MLRNKRADNPKEPTPETGHAASRPTDRRRERLRRPPVQHGVEHGLKEVLQCEKALVFGDSVDGREQEYGRPHEA